jgi:hypothetical protein
MKPFTLSDETERLVRFLQSHNKGDVVTYEELSRVIGLKVTSTTAKLIYARKILLRDHNAVWTCVRPRIGIKRLRDTEMAERQDKQFLPRARNQLNRGADEADAVEYKELDIDQQSRFAVANIQRQLGLDALSKATRKRLEKVSRGNGNDLPVFSAIEWAISLMPKAPK